MSGAPSKRTPKAASKAEGVLAHLLDVRLKLRNLLLLPVTLLLHLVPGTPKRISTRHRSHPQITKSAHAVRTRSHTGEPTTRWQGAEAWADGRRQRVPSNVQVLDLALRGFELTIADDDGVVQLFLHPLRVEIEVAALRLEGVELTVMEREGGRPQGSAKRTS